MTPLNIQHFWFSFIEWWYTCSMLAHISGSNIALRFLAYACFRCLMRMMRQKSQCWNDRELISFCLQMMNVLYFIFPITVEPLIILDFLVCTSYVLTPASQWWILDPVLWNIAIHFHSLLDVIVCWSHAATPISQWWITWILYRNIAVSKLLLECNQLAISLLECYVYFPLEANLF